MFRRKIFFFIFILFILMVLGYYFFINSSLFKIKNIALRKEFVDCIKSDEEIKKNSEIFSQNIFFFNSKNVETNLKGRFYCIRNVTFTRKFPNGMELTIVGREAEAKLIPLISEATASSNLENIATPSAKDYADIFLVDDQGIVFSKGKVELDLPILFILGDDVKLGEQSPVFIINAVKIFKKIKTLGIDIKSAKIAMSEFLITDTIPKMIFKLTEKIDIQLASLQLILEQAKIDSNILEFIDLRFDKPVVRSAPKKNG